MKIIFISLFAFFSIYSYSQGCVDRVVCSDNMVTIHLLDGSSLTWGRNEFGQLGNGTTTSQITPITTVNVNNWVDVNHARMHTVALHQNGTVWSWGNNAVGQLGTGNIIASYVPMQMGSDTDWAVLSPGNLHTVALKNNGTLWGWGNTGANELTNGPAPFYHVNPIQMSSNTDWNKIYGGYFKTFAIKNNGTLWGRGSNYNGDLGTGNTLALINLTQIGTDTDWLKISAARQSFTLALKNNGTLWAWGNNENGRLGDGTTINRHSPVQIGTSTWKDIAAGNYHSIGIKTDGTLWQWGSYGWFTAGILIPLSNSPVQVGTDSDWKKVEAGNSFSYAIKEDNTLHTWGNKNIYYGDYTLISDLTPTLMTCNLLSSISFQETELNFYPNPIVDELNIIQSTEIESFEIFNILGQIVMRDNIKGNKINLSELTKGIYICLFYKNNGQPITHKFIKQ